MALQPGCARERTLFKAIAALVAVIGLTVIVVPSLAAGTRASEAPELDAQIAVARTVAARWPTAADAMADGWTLAENYSSHVGAHYMRFAEIDSVFDVSRPEMLLYGGDSPASPIVGLAYYVVYKEPAGFAGPTDMWHQHIDACVGPNGPLVGADGVGVCSRDMETPGRWAWMLHVWAVPGWDSPQGVFSMENTTLP